MQRAVGGPKQMKHECCLTCQLLQVLFRSYAEQKEFKASIRALQRKHDEENFEEAEAQAVRMWSEKNARPSSGRPLFLLTTILGPVRNPGAARSTPGGHCIVVKCCVPRDA